jgi:hypothetical protein
MNRDKQIEEMAKDISEATRLTSQRLVEETKAFVKENHRYHSKNDFDKAHEKTMSELEAEYLYTAGYRKASDVARDIFEELEKFMSPYRYPIIADLKKKYTEGNDG